MSARAAVESVALDDAGESFSFRPRDDIYLLTRSEYLNRDAVAYLIIADVVNLDFPEIAADLGVLHVAPRRFVGPFVQAKSYLDRLITVGFNRLHLGDEAGTGFYDRNRHHSAVFQEDLAHSNLFTEKALQHIFNRRVKA